MSEIVIRKATKADLPAVLQLSSALIKDPNTAKDKFANDGWLNDERGQALFKQALQDDSQAVWVAADGDKIVSFGRAGQAPAQYWRPVKRVQFFSLYVLPEYRSHGVGTRMFDYFFDWARSQGAKVAVLMVYAENVRAMKLYRTLGFHDQMVEMESEL